MNVTSLKSIKNGDELFIAQIENFLAISYTDLILLNTIDRSQRTKTANPKFEEALGEVGQYGFSRLYINYKFIDGYINVYANINASLLNALGSSFSYSGMDMKLSENSSKLCGYASLPNSTSALVNWHTSMVMQRLNLRK